MTDRRRPNTYLPHLWSNILAAEQVLERIEALTYGGQVAPKFRQSVGEDVS